jgi:nitronate monooxygenase
MFIASGPELVVAQCLSGVVGSFPALNARPQAELDRWLTAIDAQLAAHRQAHPDAVIGPVAVNQIVHASNTRLEADLDVCIAHRVPIIISSLRAPESSWISRVHAYGGIVLHDVINVRHAQKALEAGVDGLIAVAAGAGGHAGTLSPFALLGEIRAFFDGPLVLSGAIASGNAILAAQAAGADLAYVGTRWLATPEARISDDYRQALVDARAADVVYSDFFTGVSGNYLRASIVAAGLDPDHLPKADKSKLNTLTKTADADRAADGAATADRAGGSALSDSAAQGQSAPTTAGSDPASGAKAWRDIWGAGQGVGQIDAVIPAAQVADRLEREYLAARARLLGGAA